MKTFLTAMLLFAIAGLLFIGGYLGLHYGQEIGEKVILVSGIAALVVSVSGTIGAIIGNRNK